MKDVSSSLPSSSEVSVDMSSFPPLNVVGATPQLTPLTYSWDILLISYMDITNFPSVPMPTSLSSPSMVVNSSYPIGSIIFTQSFS